MKVTTKLLQSARVHPRHVAAFDALFPIHRYPDGVEADEELILLLGTHTFQPLIFHLGTLNQEKAYCAAAVEIWRDVLAYRDANPGDNWFPARAEAYRAEAQLLARALDLASAPGPSPITESTS